MSETKPFKLYYDAELAERLGEMITAVYPTFDTPSFVSTIAPKLDALAFKGRIALFADGLRQFLPEDYPTAIDLLCQTMGTPIQNEEGMFNDGYHLWPIAYFVEAFGIEHFDESMTAMHAITQRHTAEFAIRPFLIRYPQETLAVLAEWATDESHHVRRLVSEGTRPRLPWAGRLHQFEKDPTPTLALLEKLKDDPSAYVRKSVANHLNDIGKAHPNLLLSRLKAWQQEGESERTAWIIRHALRNFVKAGHPEALALLGYGEPQVSLVDFAVSPAEIELGGAVGLTFGLQSEANAPQKLVVDYIVHHVKGNGETSPKVFKLKNVNLAAGETLTFRKKHAVKPITTRRYYSGTHLVQVQVNGQVVGERPFMLHVPE